ncbi:hypothetical protein MJO28_005022 [Puccinia striiformis f. sp. tritici]|uniref:Uncharacterized protein n=5 Tax=Puccinia striiformis TaxID=27350 RepID=A0A0L0USV0_9BASI|nr:hypothetical protein MJO28_005022 [Puccinia striiformis f. sp. tritici]KAI7960013.1 hypothetical protein MJO29_005081 [Puccinia striiformis f. sp. tritici]KNE89834.1 hypothetical protein PSTG_16695 [Puccinia striiformis f. sp. tritici PST-78]POW11729.1 hypothetical protein PSTT_05014 [Puccinia striiformis]POW23535.1 hypothetical protein PSHT_00151 [Puccinia striiformis]
MEAQRAALAQLQSAHPSDLVDGLLRRDFLESLVVVPDYEPHQNASNFDRHPGRHPKGNFQPERQPLFVLRLNHFCELARNRISGYNSGSCISGKIMGPSSAPKARCLIFERDGGTIDEVEGQTQREEREDETMTEDSSINPHRPKVIQPARSTCLRSQTRRRSTPLEPSLSCPLEVESIIQRNELRRAHVELGLYLILDQPPGASRVVLPPLATKPCYDAEDSNWPDSYSHLSDRNSLSLSSYLTNHRPPSMIQPAKTRWCSRWSKRYS